MAATLGFASAGRTWAGIAGVVAVVWSLFQIYAGVFVLIEPLKARILHVSFALTLGALLLQPRREPSRPGLVDLFPATALLVAGGAAIYVFVDYERIVTRIPFVDALTTLDYLLGIALIVLVLEMTRRTSGLALALITLTFIAYGFAGPWIPGPLGHRGISFGEFVETNFLTMEGLLGIPIGVSAEVVFYFVFFAAVLHGSGAGQFFIDAATALGGRLRGGPAKIAVIASGLFGTVSGSAVANVVGTGVFTIPLMKRIGYKPAFAGAVEAVASTGGQIMPPVMGAAAFVMAEMIGVPYLAIVKAAIIPALLYYLSVFATVHLVAVRDGLTGVSAEEVRQVRKVLWQRAHLLIPLGFLVWQILRGYSPSTAAIHAAAIAIVVSWASRSTRMGGKQILQVLRDGAEKSVAVAVPCAAAGIIIGMIAQSGLGLKFTSVLLGLAGGELLPTLLLAMLISLVLGTGMPSTSAYILTAVLVAPALVNMGISIIAAHLFSFYFAMFAMVTPPVALAAYAAAGLAGAAVWQTGRVAFMISLPAFLVAYGVVYNQALIMDAPVAQILIVTGTAAVGVLSMAAGVVGFFATRTTWPERFLLFVAAPLLIVPEFYTDVVGLLVVTAVVGREVVRRRQVARTVTHSPHLAGEPGLRRINR